MIPLGGAPMLAAIEQAFRNTSGPVTDAVGDGPDRSKNWILENTFGSPARAATSFFAGTDFKGQVNFLTTSAVDVSHGWLPAQWPRGVASVAVGAAGTRLVPLRLRAAPDAGKPGSNPVEIVVESVEEPKLVRREKSTFLLPR